MRFNPSRYSDYGSDDSSASTSDTSELLEEYAPAISALLFGGDPREKYEKKKANLQTYKELYNKTPSAALRAVYLTKIRSLEAELVALEEIVGEERAGVITTQAGKVGGTFMLVAGGVAALLIANYFRQKSRTEKLQQQALRRQLG